MGMRNIASSNRASQTTIHTIRELIYDEKFCHRHRAADRHFTRQRVLTFPRVMVLLLQKTVRSVQLHLHDFFAELKGGVTSVANSSWSEARLKLKHTAFIELNERAILEVAYGDQQGFEVRRWRGHRLLGIDSSLLRLPNVPALGREFGWVKCGNQAGVSGRHPQARLSALTDVLNGLVIDTRLVPWEQGERGLAPAHLPRMAAGDIGILDRGFAAYELWAEFVAQQRLFVCRCPKSHFSVVNQLFADDVAGRSVTVVLEPGSAGKLAEVRRAGLPEALTVRLVTVRLETGLLEVLATNLMNEALYPTAEFGELYHCRWGIETYYGLIKGRLDLENFSGESAEAIRQDVHATVFISNLESILRRPAQAQLEQSPAQRKHAAQVNRAVSFHALKSLVIQLLLSDEPADQVLCRLQSLFQDNPGSRRPNRKVPRPKQSGWRSYYYQRNIRKTVF
jgi:Transposase DDE domain